MYCVTGKMMQQNSIKHCTAPQMRNNKKSFRTTSNEDLCTLTGLTAIAIKAEEAAKLYNKLRKSQFHEIDHEAQPKAWFNAADSVRPTEQQDQPAIHIHRRQQERARGWSWNSNIYPERFSASIKVYATQ